MTKWFTGYKPIHVLGWICYAVVIAFLAWDFRAIDVQSHSVSDTLINFFPHAAAAFLLLAVVIRARR